MSTTCGSPLKLDLRRLTGRGVCNLKALANLELDASDDVSGEGLDGVVVRKNAVVEALSCVDDLVLGVGQISLEILEACIGLELRVAFGDGKQRLEGVGERVGGLHLGLGGARLRRGSARPRYRLKRLGLMARVALDRVHEVGDEVIAPLELGIYGLPRVVAAVVLRWLDRKSVV